MTDRQAILGILGANGRMGQAIDRLTAGAFTVAARVSLDRPDYAALGGCDVVIDFSSGSALMTALPHMRQGTALVSGTTGLSPEEEAAVQAFAETSPVLRSGNFSLGITLLCALAERASASLGEDWDIEILEMHHRHKTDAPSGTGLMLGQAVATGREVSLDDKAVHDRSGARKAGDIGFSVLRGGGVYGLHEVRLASESEMITLGHQALNRDVFAEGAIKAAHWLIGQTPGLYGMTDLISV